MNKKTKIFIIIIAALAIIGITLLVFYKINSKIDHPNMMKILTSECSEDALKQLGTDCRWVGDVSKMSYVFDNIEIDSINYDRVYVTETDINNVICIGFELTINDLSELKSYIKDIDKYYGEHSNYREDTYTWKSDNGLNPEIWIHNNKKPYKVTIKVIK